MKDKFRVWVQKARLNQPPSQPTGGHWGLGGLPLQSAASRSFSCLAPFPPVVLSTFPWVSDLPVLPAPHSGLRLQFPLMKGAGRGVCLLRHLSSAPTKEVCPPSSSADSGNGFYQPTCTSPATQISFPGA